MARWGERGAVFFRGSIGVALALTSCGGRASSLSSTDSSNGGVGASSSFGGTVAVGGSSARGGTGTSAGGSSAIHAGGATSSAGTSSDSGGAPPACDVGSCLEVDCPPGQIAAYLGTPCCPVCEPCSASDEICPPAAECGAAAHLEILAGSCCSECVANDQVACMKQLDAANAAGHPLFQMYGGPCQQDSDCASAPVQTSCGLSCLYGPKGLLGEYAAAVKNAEDCSACPLPPIPDTPLMCPTLGCSQGVCVDSTPI